MTGIDHPCSFHHLPVFTLPGPGDDSPWPATLPTPDAMAWRLDCGWEGQEFAVVWQHFLEKVDPAQVRALVIGHWWDGDYTSLAPVVELITSDAARFPALRALFLADVVGEECEVSWLQMCDITPVLRAFPLLEELVVRGGGSGLDEETLELRPVRHEALKALRFESGGLPGHVVRAVGACELPALERLELWLGSQWYAGDATVADMAPLLSGGTLPGCVISGSRTARSRTRSPWRSPPPRSWRSWSPWRCRWARSATRGAWPFSKDSRSPIWTAWTCTTTTSATR